MILSSLPSKDVALGGKITILKMSAQEILIQQILKALMGLIF